MPLWEQVGISRLDPINWSGPNGFVKSEPCWLAVSLHLTSIGTRSATAGPRLMAKFYHSIVWLLQTCDGLGLCRRSKSQKRGWFPCHKQLLSHPCHQLITTLAYGYIMVARHTTGASFWPCPRMDTTRLGKWPDLSHHPTIEMIGELFAPTNTWLDTWMFCFPSPSLGV